MRGSRRTRDSDVGWIIEVAPRASGSEFMKQFTDEEIRELRAEATKDIGPEAAALINPRPVTDVERELGKHYEARAHDIQKSTVKSQSNWAPKSC